MQVNDSLLNTDKKNNNYIFFSNADLKLKADEEEHAWTVKAFEDIKEADTGIKSLERIGHQLNRLTCLTSAQITRRVERLYRLIQQQAQFEEAVGHLHQAFALLMMNKGFEEFEIFLKTHEDKRFAIELILARFKKRTIQPQIAMSLLQNYGIDPHSRQGQKALLEIAKLAVQKNGREASKNINTYGINASLPEGQAALIEIAKLAAQKHPETVLEHIQSYGIEASTPEGQRGLIELAKLIALQNGGLLSSCIKNFKIDMSTPEGELAMLEIAQLAAKQNGAETSLHIENYGFDPSTEGGQKALIQIAKQAAQQSGVGVSLYIQNYRITPSSQQGLQALIEIAKLAARQAGRGTSLYIKNYGIDVGTQPGLQALLEIAKLAALQNGKGTSQYIKNYGFNASTPEGLQALTEIAAVAAQQNGEGTSEYIENYGFKADTESGQQALFTIAKLAVQQNASCVLKHLPAYHLEKITPAGKRRDEDLSNYIFVHLVKQSPSSSYEAFKESFKVFKAQYNGNGKDTHEIHLELFDLPYEKIKAQAFQDALKECVKITADCFRIRPEHLQWLESVLVRAASQRDKSEFLEWWICLASWFSSRVDLQDIFNSNQDFFESLAQQPSDLRFALTQAAVASSEAQTGILLKKLIGAVFCKPFIVAKVAVLPRDLRMAMTSILVQACYGGQPALRWESMKKVTDDVVHVQLACLILSQFPSGDLTPILATIKSDRQLRIAAHQQLFLEMLIAVKNSTLDEAAKITLLRQVCNLSSEDKLTAYRHVTDILNFKGEVYLSGALDLLQLKAAIQKLFADKFQVRLDNFSTLYDNTVAKWRRKEALLTYAGKHVSDLRVMPYLQLFLESIMKGEFHQIRYMTDNNPHLEDIQKRFPEVFEKWQVSVALKDEDKWAVKPMNT